jgi:hypothetical protein
MVDDFYSALADGHPVGAALRSAKLAAIRRNAPASEWAAFSVVGDPMVTVALTQPHDFAMVWIVVAMAGVLSLLVIVTKTLNHESTKDTKARMGRESSAKRSALSA